MDLYLLNELNKLEEGGAGSAPSSSSGLFLPNDTLGEQQVIPCITRVNDRQNTDNWTWTSNSPWTSFSTYGGQGGDNDAEHGVYDALGKAYTNAGSRSAYDNGTRPEIFHAVANYVGAFSSYNAKWNGSSYGPYRTNVMFWKNMSGTTRTFQAYGSYSSYWQSGHDGASIWIGKPNSTDKASVSSISWTRNDYTGSTTQWNGSVNYGSIPNGETVTVLGMNTLYYHQDSSSVGSWQDLNYFYNLTSLWNDGWRPDYDMYKTAILGRKVFSMSYNNRVKDLYQMCAQYFPVTP